MKYFDEQERRLVFVGERANDHFWDRLWDKEDLAEVIRRGTKERFIRNITGRFLPPGSRVLEGGCGRGEKVYGLRAWGYEAYGVDYAAQAVARIKKLFPDLQISVGDVRHLDFSDSFFDGYWSLGVIEHFYDGYDDIIREMARVVRPGGYLFLTFPYMSPLRRLKARMGRYPALPAEISDIREHFYQFALPHATVITKLEQAGFRVVRRQPFDAIKGLKDELHLPFQKLYRSTNFFARAARLCINTLCEPFASHVILLVAQKNA
jgi:SAM-dependent methyltransferase